MRRADLDVFCAHLRRWHAETVAVTEEKDALALASSELTWLDPLAPSGSSPHTLDEANRTATGVGSVVLAHDRLDGLAGLVGIVEGNDTDVVMKDVGLNNTVHEVAADEPELTVDGCGGTACEVPRRSLVVRESRISVLEEGDCNCAIVSSHYFG